MNIVRHEKINTLPTGNAIEPNTLYYLRFGATEFEFYIADSMGTSLRKLVRIDGKSAYELWLDNGNVGTLSNFFTYLKGEKGDKGDQGIQGLKGEKGDDGVDGEKGLRGEKGDKGDRGLQGFKGEKGDKGENGNTIVKTFYNLEDYQNYTPKFNEIVILI